MDGGYFVPNKDQQELVSAYRQSEVGKFATKSADDALSDVELDAQLEALRARLAAATSRISNAQSSRARAQNKMFELSELRQAVYRRVNELEGELQTQRDDNRLLQQENQSLLQDAEKFMKINVLNDAFFLWYSGPYGTINNFRLGNMSVKVVDWLEINTALGQTALALSAVAMRLPAEKFLFTKYMIYPMGSQTKVYKVTDAMIKQMYHSSTNQRMASVHKHARDGNIVHVEDDKKVGPGEYCVTGDAHSASNYNFNYHFDRYNAEHFAHYMQTHTPGRWGNAAANSSNSSSSGHGVAGADAAAYFPLQQLPAEAVLLNLYMDPNQTFTFFPRSKFNAALFGLFCCIYELGEYIKRHDPPLAMPHKIDIDDGAGRVCTISPTNSMSRKAAEPLDLLWHGTAPVPNTGVSSGSILGGSASASAAAIADERWTRALKFALADVKWIVAWSSKHYMPT